MSKKCDANNNEATSGATAISMGWISNMGWFSNMGWYLKSCSYKKWVYMMLLIFIGTEKKKKCGSYAKIWEDQWFLFLVVEKNNKIRTTYHNN